MSSTAAILRELHRIHRQLADLRSRLQRGPRQIQAAETNLEKRGQELKDAKEVVLRTRVTADQKELQLRERENRIHDLKARLNSCSTNREYQSFIEQIAADEQANSVLSDEILELLDKITELQGHVRRAEQAVEKSKADVEEIRKRVSGERDSLETDLGRLTAELTTVESRLPSEFKADYVRIVAKRGEDALAELDGECCGGCYQTITSQMLNELMLDRPVFCKSCGCLMYLPEGRGPND